MKSNKIVKKEFLVKEDIPNIDDGKIRYDSKFVKVYNETRARRNKWSYSKRDVSTKINYIHHIRTKAKCNSCGN
jgi:hypothetical protein